MGKRKVMPLTCKNCGQPMEAGRIVCETCGFNQDLRKVTIHPKAAKLPKYGLFQPDKAEAAPPGGTASREKVAGDKGKVAEAGTAPVRCSPEAKQKRRRKAHRILAVLLMLLLILGTAAAGWQYHQLQMSKNAEAARIHGVILAGKQLKDAVEALFAAAGSDYIKAGLTVAELEECRAARQALSRFSKKGAGEPAAIDEAQHNRRLDEIDERLLEATEKYEALSDISPLFETEILKGSVCAKERPLSPHADAETIAASYAYYGGYDRESDLFWRDIYTVLADADLEIHWVADAEAIVAQLEQQALLTPAEYRGAEREIAFLYDGTRKQGLTDRLTALTERVQPDEAGEPAA